LDHLTRAVKLLEVSEVPKNIALQGDHLYRNSGDDREEAVQDLIAQFSVEKGANKVNKELQPSVLRW
jgi:hypothetical protein